MTNLKSHIEPKANRRFRRLALNTIIVLYLLIVAGGVVRSTGSGMGCPDWPRCFGRWVPPTELSELPADYKEVYRGKLKGEVIFNPAKTWTEYVNRLIGAFTGVMIFLLLLASLPFLKRGPRKIFYYSLSAFLLVGFQGWLGAKVVSFELAPVVVTLHMLLAIVIVFLVLYLFTWARFFGQSDINNVKDKAGLSGWGVAAMSLSLVQILLGTQVRETMDVTIAALGYDQRALWIGSLGTEFYIHRSFSILLVLINGLWIYKVLQVEQAGSIIRKFAFACAGVLGIELLTGISMAYLGVPALAQPSHLVLAIILIGLQYMVWLLNSKRYLSTAPQSGAPILVNE
ncbi:COX15/CtaA family protein [Dyadobacter sandarakinus]|uniref:COX15/CtaA family protein n=1 Tax=Dyadobacter sandarakinus TaxID=2747268 RepID=A0ABX7IBF7_9BACT|nr:COX15/CtaA family protein [Dyadobacter sandarakinus]QRR03145.1 COX15/CtaA family protein [Dyadobacter sandarakinus]